MQDKGIFNTKFTRAEETAILSVFFTNPYGDVSFVIPGRGFGPEEQAALAARYSRSPEPYQKKFMKLLDPREMDMHAVDRIIRNPSLARQSDFVGRRAKGRSEAFHTQFALGIMDTAWKDQAIRGFGHGSIKDGANLVYHVEQLPEIWTKLVTAQPTNRPQVASTRYIEWGDIIAAAESNPDIANSRHAEEIIGLYKRMMDAYPRFTDIGEKFIAEHALNGRFKEQAWLSDAAIDGELQNWMQTEREEDPDVVFKETTLARRREKIQSKREKDWTKYARKTCLDSTRSLLLPGIPTFMAVATDATSLERDITRMLSHPLQSVQALGESIKTEAVKIIPTLMGAYSHAKRDEHAIMLAMELGKFAASLSGEGFEDFEDPGRVKYYKPDGTYGDHHLAAAVLYPFSHHSYSQLRHHFAFHSEDVDRVVDIMMEARETLDPNGFCRDADQLMQGGSMYETLINWGADRDLVRHRRENKQRQLLSTNHGFEMPPLIEEFGLKEDFHELMAEAKKVYELVAEADPHLAQLVVPFAYRVRRLVSAQFGQDLFKVELRSRIGGHPSYRAVACEMADALRERNPKFSRLLRDHREEYPLELINLKQAKTWYDENCRD